MADQHTTHVEPVEPFTPERRAELLDRAELVTWVEGARRQLSDMERALGLAPSGRVAQLEAENAELRRQVQALTTFKRQATDVATALLTWRPPAD